MLTLVLLLALSAGPNPAETLLQRGLVALQHGQLAEARVAFEEASRLEPGNPYVWASLAETYLRFNESEKAESAASKAEQLGGTNPIVRHALAMFSFEYAQVLLHREDFTKAADVLSAALRTNPRDAQLTLALGVARYGQRRFDDAITEFLRVIQIDPSIEQPYDFLGRMLDQAGPHLPEITADDEAWAKSNPQNARAPLLLAEALLASDEHSRQAEELLRRSVALDGENWESHYQLGVFLANKHDYQAAAIELRRSIELDPNQATAHYHLARVYDRLGQPDRAKAERKIHQRLTAEPNRGLH